MSKSVEKANSQSELIPIQDNGGVQAVLGRDLHAFLEVGRDYTNWMKQMINYGFTAGHDFELIKEKSAGHSVSPNLASTRHNHVLSLDMAKEICMIQRSPLGKQARQYFIECEKRARNAAQSLPGNYVEALEALVASEKRKLELEATNRELAPKALFADAVAASPGSLLIREFAKELKQNGVDTGDRRLRQWFRENGYLISAQSSDRNTPTQYAMDRGLFEVTEHVVHTAGREPFVSTVTRVTGKGRQYFMRKLLGGEHVA